MILYWFLLLCPIGLSARFPKRSWTPLECWLIFLVLSLSIGLRHEVGGDWFNYLPILNRAQGLTLTETLAWGDPGYNTLNYIFSSYHWGIYAVNYICAAIFAAGLISFARNQPRPWLALSLSIPYLVIVVAMGYSRQAVAIGLILPGLIALEQGHFRTFLFFIASASSFHSSALLTL